MSQRIFKLVGVGLPALFFAIILQARPAFAASNSGITYHGRVLKPDGSPLESTQVEFKIQIRSPGSEDCLMYEETQIRNMAGSAGVFSITLNDGTGTRTDGNSYTLDSIFANRGSFTFAAGACVTDTTYNTNSGDGRQLVMFFRADSMANWEQLPSQPVNFAPMAIEAKQIGGFRTKNLLRLDDTAAAANTTPFTSTQFNSLVALVDGSSTQYVKASSTAGAAMPAMNGSPSPLTAGAVWFDTSSNQLKYYNGTAVVTVGAGGGGTGTVTSVTGTAPITVGGTAADPVIGISQATTTTNGYLSSTDWNTFNSKMSSTLANGKIFVGDGSNVATAVTPSGDVSVTTAGGFTVTRLQGVAVSATAPTTAGQVLRYDGTSSYVPAQLSTGDISGLTTALGNKIDASQMPANCSSGQTLTFSSPTGSWACSTISLSAAGFGSQTANTVLAAPNGSAGSPTFRALVAADIPSLDAAKITSGTVAVAQGGTGTSTGSITGTGALTFAAGGTNQNVTLTPSGTGATVLGGNVGVGTTNPSRLLHVNGPMQIAASTLPGTPATGDVAVDSGDSNKLKWYDGSAWQAAGRSIAGAVSVASTPYTITSSDSGKAFYYSNNANGVINLPALSGVSDGFSVTISRDVAKNLTITANGSDKFPGGIATVEMLGKNLQSVTVMKLGSSWKLINQTEECTVGQECWTADAVGGGTQGTMKQIYVGTYKGRQYFTTPGGCTNSATPTCAGGTDSNTFVWSTAATTSGTTAGNTATILGANTESSYSDATAACATCGTTGMARYLGTAFTDTAAARFCADMNYAGYTDWYLPSKEELGFLYRNSQTVGGFVYSSNYWSSTENLSTTAFYFNFGTGIVGSFNKPSTYYVRCVRIW